MGEPPVEGEVFIAPPEGSVAWRYTVDLNEDGVADRTGVLDLGIGFRYRFETPGVHTVHVGLTGPDGIEQAIALPVVVTDAGPIRILAEGRIDVDPLSGAFEGIAVSPAGEAVYVADFRAGGLYRLDPATLEVIGFLPEIPGGVEGLTITPSGEFLYAAFKRQFLASVDLESFVLDQLFGDLRDVGRFFIAAPREGRALVAGQGPLVLVDMATGQTLGQFRVPGDDFTSTWHFDISPNGQIAAVIERDVEQGVHILDMATLQSLKELPTGSLTVPQLVSFDPSGDRVYLFGRNEENVGVFVVVDTTDGTIAQELALGEGGCGSFCAANPTATSMSGRYVAVEWQSSAFIIDTETDLPEHTFLPFGQRFTNGGLSVASSPTEDVFYFLSSGGTIYKVAIEE